KAGIQRRWKQTHWVPASAGTTQKKASTTCRKLIIWRRQNGKFRHGWVGLAATDRLGSVAQLSARPGAGTHESARAGRDVAHVRRKCPLCDEHADAGLEPAEAGATLCALVRRRPAGAVRTRRPRRAYRAPFAVDPERKHPLVVCMDQGRGGA